MEPRTRVRVVAFFGVAVIACRRLVLAVAMFVHCSVGRAGGIPGAAAEVAHLWEEACAFYAASLAKNTVVQYDFHVKTFACFCVSAGFNFEQPCEYEVMVYVAFLARSVAAGSVRQYLKGLKNHYKQRGFPVFADPLQWPHLYATLKGIDRVKKLGVCKKSPVTPAMLLRFRPLVGGGPEGLALWACMLVTFFGYFRKSNTTSEGASPFGQGKCLRVCDIPLKYALKISVHEAKNRQFGKGAVIYIAGCQNHPLDPVAAWRAHLLASRLEAVCHAFSFRIAPAGVRPMHHSKLVMAAKSMAVASGVDPATIAATASDAEGRRLRSSAASRMF